MLNETLSICCSQQLVQYIGHKVFPNKYKKLHNHNIRKIGFQAVDPVTVKDFVLEAMRNASDPIKMEIPYANFNGYNDVGVLHNRVYNERRRNEEKIEDGFNRILNSPHLSLKAAHVAQELGLNNQQYRQLIVRLKNVGHYVCNEGRSDKTNIILTK